MELRHLLYFKTLAEELHFGNAAKRLFISQPPLSRQIKELENELQVDLFHRNNKKVALTEAGQYFYAQINELIDHLEQVKNTTRLIHEQVSGELRLGYISSTPKGLIARILEELKMSFPNLQINLIEASSQSQIASLESGKLDLSIIRSHSPNEVVVKKLLFKDELCIVGNANNYRPASIAQLSKMDYISFNQDYAPEYFRLSEEFCNKLGFEPKIKHQCNNMNAILELVKLNIGYAIAPLSMVKDMSDLSILSSSNLKHKVESNVFLAYHQDNSRTGLMQIIERIIKIQK